MSNFLLLGQSLLFNRCFFCAFRYNNPFLLILLIVWHNFYFRFLFLLNFRSLIWRLDNFQHFFKSFNTVCWSSFCGVEIFGDFSKNFRNNSVGTVFKNVFKQIYKLIFRDWIENVIELSLVCNLIADENQEEFLRINFEIQWKDGLETCFKLLELAGSDFLDFTCEYFAKDLVLIS